MRAIHQRIAAYILHLPNYRLTLAHLWLVVIVGCVSTPEPVAAKSVKTDLYYAGVSFLGDSNRIKDNYPVAAALNKFAIEGVVNPLDQLLYENMSSAQLPFNLIKFQFKDYESGPSIVVSLAIERETISIDTLAEFHKLIAEVNAQILLFDYHSMRLLASIPVSIARNAVVELDADLEQAKLANLRALYQPSGDDKSIFDLATEQLQQAKIPGENALRVKVLSLSFNPISQPFIPNSLEMTALSQILGQYFTAQLAHYGKFNMIPYMHGYATRQKMAARMSNGDVYQLELPEPDFVVDVEIANFKAVSKKHKNLYASKVLLTAGEATAKKPLIDDHFHYAVAKLVTSSQRNTDDWAGFEDSLESLFTEIAQQMKLPNKKWMETHSKKKRKNYKTFKQWSKQFDGM